ncbi:CPBP family intramembrane glutamic endopeptidase [Metabacillus sp. RGM 3146]|uniref:CPBP family intramembrane glutamic endopeptidase n=1 Tax=Metabacillus sp. RGM 3146 TaxID=3401092 RepID=UPI003B9981DA
MKHYLFDVPGQNSWKRNLSSLAVIGAFVFIGGLFYAFAAIFTVMIDGKDSSYFDLEKGSFIGLDPTFDLLYLLLNYVFWLLGIWIAIRFIHKRTMTSLITAEKKINWNTVFWGYGIYMLLTAAFQAADYLISPKNYAFNETSPSSFILLFFIVLFLVPIQTTVEELFFRGFLLQWFAKKIRNPIALALIMAVIFGSLHFANPEMGRSAVWVGLSYLFMGFMLSFIAVKMGTSELSVGAHMANNMFLFWLFADEKSVGGTLPAPFKILDSDPISAFIWEVCVMIIFYFLSYRKYKKRMIAEETTHTAAF